MYLIWNLIYHWLTPAPTRKRTRHDGDYNIGTSRWNFCINFVEEDRVIDKFLDMYIWSLIIWKHPQQTHISLLVSKWWWKDIKHVSTPLVTDPLPVSFKRVKLCILKKNIINTVCLHGVYILLLLLYDYYYLNYIISALVPVTHVGLCMDTAK